MTTTATTSTARSATPELVAHLVREVLRQDTVRRTTGPLAVGVRARPVWDRGPLTVDGHPVTVAPCVSPLAVRAALNEHLTGPGGGDGTRPVLVVACDLAETELGDDILGRLVRPRLLHLDEWQAVRARFGVRRLDPALGQPEHRWLADALLEVPVDTSATRPAVLSIDTAVDLVARHLLGIDHVSMEQVLVASTDPAAMRRLAAAPAPTQAGLAEALAQRFGPVGALVCGAIAAGHADDALALGLAARGLVGHIEGSYALARIEAVTGGVRPDDRALDAYAGVAERAVTDLELVDTARLDRVLAAGDLLLRELQVPDPAATAVLHGGFDARLAEVGAAIAEVAATPAAADPTRLRDAVARLRQHRDAGPGASDPRAERGVLAARLALWVASPTTPEATDLAAAALGYLEQGAFVDWARRRVAEGDTNPALAAALEAVGRAAEARRAVENHRFAELLARWSEHGTVDDVGSSRLVPVEAVLDRVVVPLARSLPVLLVVLDGAGLASFVELAGQFRGRGLLEVAPDGTRLAGVAALPTVTQVSRTSLLSGRLAVGNQADEARALPAHPGVARLAGSAAVVFHKGDLAAGIGQPLPEPVRAALGPDGPRVVAAVVNTIDDQLAKGDFCAAYRIDDLGPLGWLLREAADAGRAVVVTADHGHVLGVGPDGKGVVTRGGDGGDRWRNADRDPTGDEVRLRGPRVLLGDDAGVLAPWHDELRYSGWHGGYHGGATPDEVLVPLAVYVPAGIDTPHGFEPAVAPAPAWWDLVVVEEERPAPPVKAPTKPGKRRPQAEGQGALFEPTAAVAADQAATPAAAGPAWLDDVLTSDVYQVQLGALGRAKPAEARVRATIGALAARDGVASFATIAQATGMPLLRVPSLLATLVRLFNVDGYAVLTVDPAGEEARFNESLARAQFLEST